MNKFLSLVFVSFFAIQGTVAFTTGLNNHAKIAANTRSIVEIPAYTQTSTSLNLKVKVDPNSTSKNTAGNAKAAAYGGSIVIAALLPIAFLVWSAISKGN